MAIQYNDNTTQYDSNSVTYEGAIGFLSVSDSLSLSETFITSAMFSRLLSDSVSLVDSIARSISSMFADALSLSESLLAKLNGVTVIGNFVGLFTDLKSRTSSFIDSLMSTSSFTGRDSTEGTFVDRTGVGTNFVDSESDSAGWTDRSSGN